MFGSHARTVLRHSGWWPFLFPSRRRRLEELSVHYEEVFNVLAGLGPSEGSAEVGKESERVADPVSGEIPQAREGGVVENSPVETSPPIVESVSTAIPSVSLVGDVEEAIYVAVIDDSEAATIGVRAWLAAATPPLVVVTSGSVLESVLYGTGATADVIVIEPQDKDGRFSLKAITQLCEQGRRVVVYSVATEADIVLQCMELGVATYLTKTEGRDHLVSAIRAAAQNRPYISPVLAGVMASNQRRDRPVLSAREREILLAWFKSDSKNLVAARFGLSTKTVDTYLARVRIKYADVGRPATTKAALVARALQDGLVDLADLN